MARDTGSIRNATARMSPMLQMVEPIALPTDVAGCSSQAAMTETQNSGAVVARLTRVAPTITLGTPVISATPTAPSVNQSAPFVIMRRLTEKRMKFIQMGKLAKYASMLEKRPLYGAGSESQESGHLPWNLGFRFSRKAEIPS